MDCSSKRNCKYSVVLRFTESMIVVLPIAMTLAWMFSVAITVRAIVAEKEQRLKEVMRMMGLGDGALRLSWYLTSLAVLTVSVAAISLILKVWRWCMCVCMCMCVHVCMHVYVCACVYACVCMCMHVYMCVHVCMQHMYVQYMCTGLLPGDVFFV